MGDVRGFMKYRRNYVPKEPVAERLKHYNEFLKAVEETDRRYAEATEKIPVEEQLPSVLDSVQTLSAGSGVHVASFTPDQLANRPASAAAAAS